MSFSLTVLGSSSALPTSKRFPTAQVLNVQERFFLIDCGEGTQIQIRRFKLPLSRIHHIFISHLHGDHVFGLFGLLSSMNLLGRKADLTIHAHAEMEETIRYFKKFFGTELLYPIVFKPFPRKRHSLIYEDKKVTVETIPLRHRIPTVGFVFREKKQPLNIRKDKVTKLNIPYRDIIKIKAGSDYISTDGNIYSNKELTLPEVRPRSYAYITDTAYYEKNAIMISNVDIMYHEATFLDRDHKLAKLTGHSTALQAARMADKSHARKLLIGHFSSRYKDVSAFVDEAKSVFENTVAVEDGDVFQVRKTRVSES
ncbi:MAG: ribonuclease Z [Bacteroidales bacterium]|nr:ribonuclease Z [Bacteroidales bacterium]